MVHASLASPPPLPSQKKGWKQNSKNLTQNAKDLSREKKKIESKINTLKEDLQERALRIQKEELSLKETQSHLEESKKGLKEQENLLQRKKENIASLIVSLVKMNSIPLDTLMLLSDDKSEDLMVAYQALESLHPALNQQINDLEHQISLLAQQKETLQKDKDRKKKKARTLKKKREDISRLITQRQKDHKTTDKAYKLAQKKALYASKTAKNLDELILTLKKKNKNILKSPQTRPKEKERPVFKTSKTKRLPVTGKILTRYGGKDNIGATSQGVTIQALSGALVVAPKAGIIKYSGTFKKYGRIILIEHGKNYHSLIAGLDKIDTVVGQKISEGAPIGSMQERTNVKHSVYYELRLNGKPVNPLTHLRNL